MLPRTRSLLLGFLSIVSVAPASAAPRLVVGRSPTVFQADPDALAVGVGAWFDGSFVDNDRRPGSVDLNHFNVQLDARWRGLQTFIEIEYEREAGLDGGEEEQEFEVEQAYLRFAPRDAFSLRAGRFNTPAGIWLPIHWSILMDTIEKPPHAAKDLLPEQQLGLEIAGRVFPRWLEPNGGQIEWSLFSGVGNDRLDQDGVEGVAAGADVRLRIDERLLVGASVYRQKNDEVEDRSEHGILAYGEFKLPGSPVRLPGAFTFRTEYLHQRRERPRGAPWDRTLDVAYAKVRWDFGRWFYANYRLSFGDDDGEDQSTTLQEVHTATLGIQPHKAVRIKLEFSDHDFRSSRRQDFRFWGASLGVRF